jgi:hypothetical protein
VSPRGSVFNLANRWNFLIERKSMMARALRCPTAKLTGAVKRPVQRLVRRGRWVSIYHSPVEDTIKLQGEESPRVSMVSGAKRKRTYSHLPLCDSDHRPALEGVPMLGKQALQRPIDPIGVHIAEAKRDDTGQRGPTGGDQFPEAQVVDQQNAPFLASLRHNLAIWYALQTLVSEMHRIVPKGL